MAKSISILGSTGSIGTQTLDVAKNLNLKVAGITCGLNIDLLERQIIEFRPSMVSVENEELADDLKKRLNGIDVEVYYGVEGLIKVATLDEIDTVVTSIVGIAGLIPTLEAIKSGKDIALANKETLVSAGEIVMSKARENGVRILPVDSEHSAIFQCLMGNDINKIKKIILTASGGPFRGKSIHELKKVTLEQALNHPNWNMGSKITIDSATMMNKGLEVIEAKWLFGLSSEQIEVVVHPQSIIHSMVEFEDGSIIAQLGSPDMRLPIQLALTYPKRINNNFSRLDLLKSNTLTFEEPDIKVFSCLKLAFDALKIGGTMPAVLNAANEIAVNLYLKNKISFTDIPNIIEKIMSLHTTNNNPSIGDIIEVDKWARKMVLETFNIEK